MYKSFYSLAASPFAKDIDPKDAFLSENYQGAMSALNYLKQVRGIGLLVGEPGTGKTFSLRSFKQSLNPALYHPIYFPLSTGGVMDFYRGLAHGLGEEPRFHKSHLFKQIQSCVDQLFTERKLTPVFILDEMHLAKDAFLQDIALLFNFQMDSANPFILILAGLPHLKTKLALNQNRPLSQRVMMQYELRALSKEDVVRYMNHHMKLAGANMSVFSDSAMEAIAIHSGGWPRMIGKIALNCLMFGARLSKEQIDEEIVRLAVTESGL